MRTAAVSCLLLLFMAVPAFAELPYVYPGGQSLGVLLKSGGVTVAGVFPVTDATGNSISPAETAGLAAGDEIVSVDGEAVYDNETLGRIVSRAGEEGRACHIIYQRDGIQRKADVMPVWCIEEESFRIGLYVRDSIAGVGTLTFWLPEENTFAALGHSAGSLQETEDDEIGSVLPAQIEGISKAASGTVGEKIGVFVRDSWHGQVETNGAYGIYGTLDESPIPTELVPVAEPEEVELGEATLLTVIAGDEIEAFRVEIIQTSLNRLLSEGGMVIRITDERLLEETGGIVQGMSGSPILQNGKLVGAVSHVFVNDPAEGYACFIRQMMEEAQIPL